MPSPTSAVFVRFAVSPDGKVYWQRADDSLDETLLSVPQFNTHVELTQPPHIANDGVVGHVQFPVGQALSSGFTEAARAPLYVAAFRDKGGCSAVLISSHPL